jgi:hypothetical protein
MITALANGKDSPADAVYRRIVEPPSGLSRHEP